jgi:hypothetical protein
MSLVGQTLKRKRKLADGRDTIRVTGWNGRGYVCECADTFGRPFVLTEADLAVAYGGRGESPLDEDGAQQQLTAEAHRGTLRSLKANPRYSKGTFATPDPASPEGKFADAAAEEAEDDGG